MGVSLDVRIARIHVRQGASLLRLAVREEKARTKTAQKKMRAAQQAEQLERMTAYVDAVVECSIPSNKRKPKPPSPSIRDFGIKNELKAMNFLFRSEKWLALCGDEPRETL
jgi:hypothetical protein